jgi:hypothetical protein
MAHGVGGGPFDRWLPGDGRAGAVGLDQTPIGRTLGRAAVGHRRLPGRRNQPGTPSGLAGGGLPAHVAAGALVVQDRDHGPRVRLGLRLAGRRRAGVTGLRLRARGAEVPPSLLVDTHGDPHVALGPLGDLLGAGRAELRGNLLTDSLRLTLRCAGVSRWRGRRRWLRCGCGLRRGHRGRGRGFRRDGSRGWSRGVGRWRRGRTTGDGKQERSQKQVAHTGRIAPHG